MLQKPFSTILVCTFVALTLPSLAKVSEAVAQPQYEMETVFEASKILPANLLVGEDYQIRKPVFNDGIQNRYEVTSSFGNFSV